MINKSVYNLAVIIFLFTGTIGLYAQNNILALSKNIYPPFAHPDTGASCSGGPGSEFHDDGFYENGYDAQDDSCRYVIKMRPAQYPWNYVTVCLTFTRISTGLQNLTFDIIVYDTTGGGGAPGNLKAIFAGKFATGIGIFPASSSFRYTLLNIPALFSGAYYIGIRYHNNPLTGVYLSQDESAGTPLWPGYQGTGNSPAVTWVPTQSVAGNQSYRCSAIRTEGSVGQVLLCEQFAAATFPPNGWTEIFTGTNYWSRVTQSGFGLGTGAARYDSWNAPLGNTQALVTPSFSSSAGDSLIFDVAFQLFPNYPDSLIILTSTDNGVTFFSFQRLGPLQLNTTSGAPTPFVPAANQWGKRQYGPLPVGTNKIQFMGKSGFGDGIYLDSICTTAHPLGIGHNENTVPLAYSLSQNYPNPFNPSTKILFGLPNAGDVKLIVYDLLGREVKVLVNEYRNAGSYNIEFDASSLASGVYFYKLEAKDFSETKRMLLIK